MRSDGVYRSWIGSAAHGLRIEGSLAVEKSQPRENEQMSEDKANDDLYRRVEAHLQELIEPDLPEAKLSPAERLELLEQARASESCRELLESYGKTIALLGDLGDSPVPADFSAGVKERVEASVEAVPFHRGALFQRMIGAAAGVALIAFVFWQAIFPSGSQPSIDLAMNDSPANPALEEVADALPAPLAKELNLDRSEAPGALKAADGARKQELASAVGESDAADEAAPTTPEPAADALPGGVEAEVARGAEVLQEKSGDSIEVSRESIDGRLVAVRYEVAVPRSRLAELKAWQAKRAGGRPAAVAARAAVEGALSGKLRAREASPPAGRAKDKSAEQAGGQPTGEFLTLLVDAGKLDALRAELDGLQGSSPARDSLAGKRKNALEAGKRASGELAAKDREKADFAAAAPGAKAKSALAPEAASAPGIPERSRQLARKAAPREARAERKENLRVDSELRQESGNSAPGVAGKAAPGGRPKVRVEIRFRIVPD